MNNNPFFSIIIPCLNSSKVITECLLSIQNQTFKNVEIVIQDSSRSSDNLKDLLKNYSNLLTIIYNKESDINVYDALNKGIARSKGKLLIFLGSDDSLFNDNVLKNVHEVCSNSTLDIIFGNTYLEERKQIKYHNFPIKELYKNVINHQAIFYNRKVFSEFGMYNINYQIAADQALTQEILSQSENFKYINVTISKYSLNGLSQTLYDKQYVFSFSKRIKKLFPQTSTKEIKIIQNSLFLQLIKACITKKDYICLLKTYIKLLVTNKKPMYSRTIIKEVLRHF